MEVDSSTRDMGTLLSLARYNLQPPRPASYDGYHGMYPSQHWRDSKVDGHVGKRISHNMAPPTAQACGPPTNQVHAAGSAPSSRLLPVCRGRDQLPTSSERLNAEYPLQQDTLMRHSMPNGRDSDSAEPMRNSSLFSGIMASLPGHKSVASIFPGNQAGIDSQDYGDQPSLFLKNFMSGPRRMSACDEHSCREVLLRAASDVMCGTSGLAPNPPTQLADISPNVLQFIDQQLGVGASHSTGMQLTLHNSVPLTRCCDNLVLWVHMMRRAHLLDRTCSRCISSL